MEAKRTAIGLGLVVAALLAGSPSAPAERDGRGAPILAAAGDVACAPFDRQFNRGRGTRRHCRQAATARLLRGSDVVMPVGDVQDPHASMKNILRGYDPAWGRYLDRTKAVVGNHEYGPPRKPNLGAGAHWRYFGERRAGRRGRGWHSFDLGRWHVVALNSLCTSSPKPWLMQRKVGCSRRSPQVRWLRRDLARAGTRCIVAAWHHPRFSSGPPSRSWPEVSTLWRVLDQAGADVVLSGHNHTYERLAKMTASGTPSAQGIRQFLVGTGGVNLARPRPPIHPHSQKRANQFGVLRLRLGAGSYEWRFVRIGGRVLDRGRAACR